MNVELQSIGSFMGGVNKVVKPLNFRRPKKGKGKKDEEKEGKETKKKSTKPTEPKEEKKPSTTPSPKTKAYQPMLPGMRGAVKPVKKESRAPKSTPPKEKKPRATQPMLPGMGKPSKAKTPKPEPKEEKVWPGGTDWASVPPVDLNPYNKPIQGRQFNG